MNKTAIRLVAFAAVAGLAIAGCSSSKKSSSAASSSPAAATSSAAPAATSSAAPAATSSAAPAATSSAPAAPVSSAAAGGGFQVGVILPDTQSSPRWETQDRPNLTAAFQAAGIKVDIQNAQASTTKFISIAQSMIQEGVKVLILTALDSASGAQAEQLAAQAGVKTIDYDRLVLGGADNFYVSFDNVKVGQLQGQGLVDCLTAANVATPWKIIELKGAPTDNNATLFAQGYDSVLNPLYASGKAKKEGEQAVPNWGANGEAGPIFENMLTAAGGKVDGVIAANDSMGQQVITVEKAHGIHAPITGQDASVPGLQSVLDGDQCGTVFKNTAVEAMGASQLAIDLIKGTDPTSLIAGGQTLDSQTNKQVPSVLETPEWVTASKVEDVVKAGQQKASDICTGAIAADCTKYGVS
jgi:D-xylose transport system substrate-binding protein